MQKTTQATLYSIIAFTIILTSTQTNKGNAQEDKPHHELLKIRQLGKDDNQNKKTEIYLIGITHESIYGDNEQSQKEIHKCRITYTNFIKNLKTNGLKSVLIEGPPLILEGSNLNAAPAGKRFDGLSIYGFEDNRIKSLSRKEFTQKTNSKNHKIKALSELRSMLAIYTTIDIVSNNGEKKIAVITGALHIKDFERFFSNNSIKEEFILHIYVCPGINLDQITW